MTTDYRYGLNSKFGKGYCPVCGRKSLVPYIDRRTGELLPEEFGRCDHQTSCGHILSPYTKGTDGNSYSDFIFQQEREQWKQDNGHSQQRHRPTFDRKPFVAPEPRPAVLQTIPADVHERSLTAYDSNNFAYLLRSQLGIGAANELVERYRLGTYRADYELSIKDGEQFVQRNFGKGGTIFWCLDAEGKAYGGQGVLFNDNGSTVKFKNSKGEEDRCNRPIAYLTKRFLKDRKKPIPEWLEVYETTEDRFPYPFGLNLIATAPKELPIALCESPKTAMLAAGYFPKMVWMAIWSLSYLNKARLESLRRRNIVLFPDCSKNGKAFEAWKQKADELNGKGFRITVSDFLEKNTTTEQKAKGYDLADFLLSEYRGYPPSWDSKPGDSPGIELIQSPTAEEWATTLGIDAEKVLRPVQLQFVG